MLTVEVIITLRRGGSTSFLIQGCDILDAMERADEQLEGMEYVAVQYFPLMN